MSKNLELKKQVVSDIVKKFQDAQSVIVVKYSGLTVEQVTGLRAQFRANGVEYCVLKNTLVRRALKELNIEGLDEVLNGPSAFAFGMNDPVSPAKIINDFIVKKKSEAIEIIPFSRNAWHAGDGSNGFANRNLIGIEIARSMDYSDDKYDRAEANAVEYIAWVCVQYGWTSEQLNQHNWYSSTACPHRLKDHWTTFCSQVDARIAEIKADAEGNPSQPDLNRPAADDQGKVKIALHGYERDVRGINKDGTVYVSVRDLLSQMGYDVGWVDGKVTIEYHKAG